MEQTIDPTTGQINPQTLQVQADQAAVKANRAGSKPVADPTAPVDATMAPSPPITYKGNFRNSSIDAAAKMFGNVPNPVPNPINFTDELRQASADGKLKGNFEKAVNAAPATAKGDPTKSKKKKKKVKVNPVYISPQTGKPLDEEYQKSRLDNERLEKERKAKEEKAILAWLPKEKGVGGDPDEDFEWSEQIKKIVKVNYIYVIIYITPNINQKIKNYAKL